MSVTCHFTRTTMTITGRFSPADEAKEKRARSQKTYRTRRDERLAASLQSPQACRVQPSQQRPAPYRRPELK
ncbi:hypothetical protein PHMEG_00022699 [Phytophthora megakarya]|uniref:Uncharacterized protein n=1 Tax=Phytophthora megakarya TaxID=4795 RepID=A0A225VJR5_9STRA|nr:hypothetical protein PHMEG_00022699 [Phytophthora megakarya]